MAPTTRPGASLDLRLHLVVLLLVLLKAPGALGLREVVPGARHPKEDLLRGDPGLLALHLRQGPLGARHLALRPGQLLLPVRHLLLGLLQLPGRLGLAARQPRQVLVARPELRARADSSASRHRAASSRADATAASATATSPSSAATASRAASVRSATASRSPAAASRSASAAWYAPSASACRRLASAAAPLVSFTRASASRSLWPRISAQCSISCSSRAVSSSAARTRASAAALASSLALRGTWRAGRCRNNQATRPPCPYDIPPELRLT